MVLLLLYWLLVDVTIWDCQFKEKTGSGEVIIEECSQVEDWLGFIYGFLNILFLSMSLRFLTMIVFAVALGRIAWLLNKLKKFGYVQHRFILRLHIAICAFDIIYNIFAAATLMDQVYNAI